jgi:hypothetical protein
MAPGELYRMKDIGAAAGLEGSPLKGTIACVLVRMCYVEPVDAQAIARAGPAALRVRLKRYKNLWRLTPEGERMRAAVLAADAREG